MQEYGSNERNSLFPDGFFTIPRPHMKEKEKLEDCIPFEWSENVLNGTAKVKITSPNKGKFKKD